MNCRYLLGGHAEGWRPAGPDRFLPPGRNGSGSYCFIFHASANDQELNFLTVIAKFICGCLAIVVVGSICSNRPIEALAKIVGALSGPTYLLSDDGHELITRDTVRWLNEWEIGTSVIDPGKP